MSFSPSKNSMTSPTTHSNNSPAHSVNSNNNSFNNDQQSYDLMMGNNNDGVFKTDLGERTYMDETIERSGSLFSQLDSMIAAVQVESSALDSMREKLRELDVLRTQLSMLTKRLLDADQTNLTLKSNLIKIQEAYADLKRQYTTVSINCFLFIYLLQILIYLYLIIFRLVNLYHLYNQN
jgi:hypothetical protein